LGIIDDLNSKLDNEN